jgi:hypothetical protein
MGMTKIARAIKGPHLNIFETDQGIEAVRPLRRQGEDFEVGTRGGFYR